MGFLSNSRDTAVDSPSPVEWHRLGLGFEFEWKARRHTTRFKSRTSHDGRFFVNTRQTPRMDTTAARVALWRGLHVQVDPPPHVLEDEIGLRLAAPDEGWRRRPDMDPQGTRPFRASIVARARFIEDLVAEQLGRGLEQYVLLGAGLDTFAQRKPELASRLRVFEVDRPAPQAWKRQ